MIGGVPYRVWANRILAGSAVLYALVFCGAVLHYRYLV